MTKHEQWRAIRLEHVSVFIGNQDVVGVIIKKTTFERVHIIVGYRAHDSDWLSHGEPPNTRAGHNRRCPSDWSFRRIPSERSRGRRIRHRQGSRSAQPAAVERTVDAEAKSTRRHPPEDQAPACGFLGSDLRGSDVAAPELPSRANLARRSTPSSGQSACRPWPFAGNRRNSPLTTGSTRREAPFPSFRVKPHRPLGPGL